MITRKYIILNGHPKTSCRTVEVHATEQQLEQLATEGYLVRQRLIPSSLLNQLRSAADELEAVHLPGAKVRDASFGGLFVRNLIDKHTTFQKLIDFAPLTSVARAMLGPQVQIHGSVLRVSYPDQPEQAVEWHFHQRVVPDQKPPFFRRPEVIDNLIYLDDLTPASGPLVVMPKSHLVNESLPARDHSDKLGQMIVTCPAGSVVTASASLWHRALASTPEAGKRRLVIVGFSPTWMKQVDRLSAGSGHGLTDKLVPDATEETRELLGLSGFF
jgi:ectoine hydroxylase-related dioxygenase (phytanoyl-CoA dioxygenase family)